MVAYEDSAGVIHFYKFMGYLIVPRRGLANGTVRKPLAFVPTDLAG